ncbi:MAG: type I 3-dehydroquinate dehydratase [Planctomycetota bacterium]
MTYLCCPIFVHDADQALQDAARAKDQGADLVEYRLDDLADQPDLAADVVARSPLPCLATCRHVDEGGGFDGEEAQRIALLEAVGLASPGPSYLDVELASYQRSANLRQKVHLVVDQSEQIENGAPPDGTHPGARSARLILSAHDFRQRPADLTRRFADMAAQPACRVVKAAWLARSLRDNLEAFELIRDTPKPAVALCMGEFGAPSRILAKKASGFLTFARLDADPGTAPGQPTLQELTGLYRWHDQTPDTAVYGVVGWPVGHSRSPHLHNAGFTAIGHDGVYLPMPVPPEYEHFKATVGAWIDDPHLGFGGASVTIPHKANLLKFVRQREGTIDPLAERVGVANTLVVRRDPDGAVQSLEARNTDVDGALDALAQPLGGNREALREKTALVLGAGGAARGIVVGLIDAGAHVTITHRRPEAAEQLAQEFGGQTSPWQERWNQSADLWINTTPLGMHPDVDDSPIGENVPASWGPGTIVFDAVYNPAQTRLLRQAKQAEATPVSGVEMFLRQGAAQFQAWTGQPAPLETFRNVMNALA